MSTGYRSRTSTHGRNMAGARSLWRATGMTDADFEQADHRHRQQLHAVRPRTRPPARRRAAREEGDRRRRRLGRRVQHHRRRRRHRHGPRRHAVLAAEPRAHRRQRRVHGERPLRRRAGLHLELRQDHARHADGRACASTSRPSSCRAGRWRPARCRHARPRRQAARPQARPHRFDDRVERRQGQRRRARRDGALGLPDLRLVLGHVHRQQHELPERGARPGAARQRHAAGDARARAGSSSRTPASASSSMAQAPLRRRRRVGAARAASRRSRRSRTRWRSTSPWAARPTPCCTSWPSPHEAGVDFTMSDIDRLSRKVPNICKVAPSSQLPRRGRAPRRRHLHDPGRARPRRPHPPRRAHRARADAWARPSTPTTSAARRPPRRPSSARWPRPGGVPTQVAFSQDKYFARCRRRRREGLHPRRRRTPTARTAAWPCSTATSPSRAAS